MKSLKRVLGRQPNVIQIDRELIKRRRGKEDEGI